MSDSLRPHESQHARPPCPSPTPGVHLDSRPSSQWCHPAISFSVVPFSSCPQSLPASVFSNESTLLMRWPKYWSFSFSIIPSKEIPGLISFRMDWLDLLLHYHLNQYVSPNIICWKTHAQCAGFGGGAFRKWLVHKRRTIMNECNAYMNSYHVPCPYHTLAMVVVFLVFWGTFILFSIVAASIYIPTNRLHINATF